MSGIPRWLPTRIATAGSVVVIALVLGACASASDTTQGPVGSTPGSVAPPASPSGPTGDAEASDVSISHIHAVARDPKSGELMVATHEGLFRLQDGELFAHGPAVDLMSFAIAPDGSYLGSGHAGPGVDLPEPVGLISSDDQGRTWTVLSRGGKSDFHALSAGESGFVGYDGSLRISDDGRSWSTATIPAPPRTLAAAPGTGTVVATTELGLLVSRDGGPSWTTLRPPELLVAATWADEKTIVGASRSGDLILSRDAGASWTRGPKGVAGISELGAKVTPGGEVEVLAVVGTSVLRTVDLGATTEKLI